MSWSSSYPPPPRHSRSRSPRAGSFPNRPDTGYQSEYWDDRWNSDGHRNTYENGRRGRSRSPPWDDTNRKRRRSPSPYERDRYDPRPRYNDDYDAHSRGRGYSPPRRGHPSRRSPQDPKTMDSPATLKQYADWFRYNHPDLATQEDNADKAAEQEAGDGSKPRNGIKTKWEKYKKEFSTTQLQTMFEHHRKSPWFAEKYDPSPQFQAIRSRVRKEGWKGRIITFLNDLEMGKFDPDFNEPVSPPKDNGNGDVDGDANAEERKVEDDTTFGMDVDEESGETDGNKGESNGKASQDRRRLERPGEEAEAVHEGNQVMIRTIPPDIGRLKLEHACEKIPGYVYMALGDPLQKRNYYRAGWIRFTEDADMEAIMAELSEKKIEGFKLHVSHSTRPFINKIRIAPEVASKPERLAQDLRSAKVLATILENQAAALRKYKIPVSEPAIDAQSNPEDPDTVIPPVTEEDTEEEEPSERGSDAVERRIEKVMADMRDQGLVDVNDDHAYEAKKTLISLDLYIAYMRNAYNTCFYCCVVTDHVEELHRKCVKHVRKPLPTPATKVSIDDEEKQPVEEGAASPLVEKEKDSKKETRNGRGWDRNDERWLEWLDSKLALLIDRDNVDPRDYGGKIYDEELARVVEPFIKHEDEGKFRCKDCMKLFRATSFVEKHIANKHPEHVKALDDLSYFNNFTLDPHRIQPFAHLPPVVGGGSNQAPPQAYGISTNNRDHGNYYDRFDSRGGSYHPQAMNGGGWDRRDDGTGARRLSDRIAGFSEFAGSTLPPSAGLPAKPPAPLDQALGNAPSRRANLNNGRGGVNIGGPPPPPPADAREDPRAAGKKVSYHDMDLVAEGDVELFY